MIITLNKDDLIEQIPHIWASCNDSFFKSNFGAKSCRAVILRKVSDWSALVNDILKRQF